MTDDIQQYDLDSTLSRPQVTWIGNMEEIKPDIFEILDVIHLSRSQYIISHEQYFDSIFEMQDFGRKFVTQPVNMINMNASQDIKRKSLVHEYNSFLTNRYTDVNCVPMICKHMLLI